MGSKYRIGDTDLTGAEIAFLATHPHLAGTIEDDAKKAISEARRRYPGTVHNGPGDAFRHCYWSSLLARDIGPENAKDFTSAHEAFDGNPSGERAMDLRNNEIGISIGRRNPGATDRALADACVRALATGRLDTSP